VLCKGIYAGLFEKPIQGNNNLTSKICYSLPKKSSFAIVELFFFVLKKNIKARNRKTTNVLMEVLSRIIIRDFFS